MSRDRYELRIARLDGRALPHPVEPLAVNFDPDDAEELDEVTGRHFVPLACAAEGEPVRDQLRHMRFLDDYVLEVWHRNRSRRPVATSRSTHGRETESRFNRSA